MEAEVWHIEEYQGVLEDDKSCTPAEMTRHVDRLLGRMHVDVLAHGNVLEGEAAALAPMISAALSEPTPLPEADLPSRHALRLPPCRGAEEGEVDAVVVDLEAGSIEENNSAVQVKGREEMGKMCGEIVCSARGRPQCGVLLCVVVVYSSVVGSLQQ